MIIGKIDIFKEFSSEDPKRNVDMDAIKNLANQNGPRGIDIYNPNEFEYWLRERAKIAPVKLALDLGAELTRNAVYDVFKGSPQIEEVNSALVHAFIEASRIKFAEQKMKDDAGQIQWQKQNRWLNYLRCIGLLPDVEYDKVHQLQIYDFTTNLEPTPFAQQINHSHNKVLIRDKGILTLGAGNGRDEKYFVEQGASSVEAVEGSDSMVEVIHKTKLLLPVHLQGRLIAPNRGENMIEALKRLHEEGKTFDTVYAHAAFHFFDDTTMMHLFELIKKCLTPEGNLAFATRKPGANMDGNGILLVNMPLNGNSTGAKVRLRAFLNEDGQVRYFRSHERVIEMVEQLGFQNDPAVHFTRNFLPPKRTPPWLYYLLFKNLP